MAIYKKVAKAGKYQDDLAIPNLIAYITRADKAKSGMIGGVGIDPNCIADSMVMVSNTFHKNSRIRLHHFIVSFTRWNALTPAFFIVSVWKSADGSARSTRSHLHCMRIPTIHTCTLCSMQSAL